ncbi:MAG: redoxin domain-containing protein [Acidimicrobiia bacterium]|nr:redoxin domain-containing protein [Acidimicrobiia bacterium]
MTETSSAKRPLPDPLEFDGQWNRRSRFWRASTLGAVFGLVGLLVVVFAGRFGKDPRLVDSPLIGKPAPSIELPHLEQSGSWSLEALNGQIVVVNFWASWCVACRLEHDDLLAAANASRDEGVQFVGVDFQDNRDDAVAFLDELGRGQGYVYLVDPGSRVAIDYGVFGIPETFFIDANGIVAAKIAGESTFDVLMSTIEGIRRGDLPAPP